MDRMIAGCMDGMDGVMALWMVWISGDKVYGFAW